MLHAIGSWSGREIQRQTKDTKRIGVGRPAKGTLFSEERLKAKFKFQWNSSELHFAVVVQKEWSGAVAHFFFVDGAHGVCKSSAVVANVAILS